jgi:hypothetical protein
MAGKQTQVLLQELIHLRMELSALYGTKTFIILFARVHQ